MSSKMTRTISWSKCNCLMNSFNRLNMNISSLAAYKLYRYWEHQ